MRGLTLALLVAPFFVVLRRPAARALVDALMAAAAPGVPLWALVHARRPPRPWRHAFVFASLELWHGRRNAVDPRWRAREESRSLPSGSPAPALSVFALGLGVLLPIVLG